MKRLFVLLTLAMSQLTAADCPSLAGEDVKWIVPSRPGGGYDAYSRLLQPFLEKRLNLRIAMENRSEAGGLVAAMALRDAVADGTTLGIVNAPGLLAASLTGASRVPDPASDFTVLGRVVSTHVVMFSGEKSGITDIDELLQISESRPILVGVRDAGSSNFIVLPVTADLLGMRFEIVTGYVGNTARTMAVLRGEIDVVFHNFDSARRYVEAGELLPLLQVTMPAGVNAHDGKNDLLAGVPILAGEHGMALRRAGLTGRTVHQAREEADALVNIFAAGRLVVAPGNMEEGLATCLASALGEVLRSDELLAAATRAGLSIDYASAETVQGFLTAAGRELHQFEPLVGEVIRQARQ